MRRVTVPASNAARCRLRILNLARRIVPADLPTKEASSLVLRSRGTPMRLREDRQRPASRVLSHVRGRCLPRCERRIAHVPQRPGIRWPPSSRSKFPNLTIKPRRRGRTPAGMVGLPAIQLTPNSALLPSGSDVSTTSCFQGDICRAVNAGLRLGSLAEIRASS